MEWKPSSVASHRLLPFLTLLAIFLVFLVTFLCSVFSVFSGQHFFCFLKECPLWLQLCNDLVSSWNCQITKCTLWSNCTTCSELFLAWFHCEIRAGLQVATARSTAVSPNLLLLWRRQIRTTFYNLELGLNTWIFCRYFVDPRIYVWINVYMRTEHQALWICNPLGGRALEASKIKVEMDTRNTHPWHQNSFLGIF